MGNTQRFPSWRGLIHMFPHKRWLFEPRNLDVGFGFTSAMIKRYTMWAGVWRSGNWGTGVSLFFLIFHSSSFLVSHSISAIFVLWDIPRGSWLGKSS